MIKLVLSLNQLEAAVFVIIYVGRYIMYSWAARYTGGPVLS